MRLDYESVDGGMDGGLDILMNQRKMERWMVDWGRDGYLEDEWMER